MFDRDRWQEIFETLRSNKLRSFLTAFSVAWGVFILIVLMAAGEGLQKGAQAQFGNDAANSLWIDGNLTSMAYAGFKPGREIQLTNTDYELIRNKIKDVDAASAVYNGRQNKVLIYKNERASFMVRSCAPDHGILEKVEMKKGRFINHFDMKDYRKVCVIGEPVEAALFKHENPIGKFIAADGTEFKVVGVFHDPGRGDNDRIYIPLTTAQRIYNAKDKVGTIWVSSGKADINRSNQMVSEIRHMLALRHHFNPEDIDAVGVYNNNVEYARIMGMLTGIKIFVLFIGICTLIAGAVGISNIMMIIVKERTREIGVRKAIGATPASIVSMIIQESVFITSIAGYVGLLAGVGLIELVRSIGIDSEFFRDPEVNFNVALFAIGIIVFTGAMAGLIPAIRAARVEPIVALRDQ